jgi:catalase
MHMVMWLMSDRALPRSYRMMQGFGVHTFRFVNAEGKGTFVKFHWRPRLGTHSLVWDETQKIAGNDPDFNRRDLWDAIDSGDHPEWDLAVQLVPEEREHDFDFDLLDATKLIPEEEVPLRVVGRMVLNRNPDNFFAETEQVAFHTANVVPGIDFTNDPLLQARNFSYLDTQLIRLGGPNFSQLPVNRPIAEVHNHQRDGYGQHRIDQAPVSYHKNSLGTGCPALASAQEGGYRHYTERVDGEKIRRRSASFQDHYTQATLFYASMSDWEQSHIADALQFELGKVGDTDIRARVVEHLGKIDDDLARTVAAGVGVDAPQGNGRRDRTRTSPALSQASERGSVATRKVAVLAADGVDAATLRPVLDALGGDGAICEVLAPHDGVLGAADGGSLDADRGLVTMSSVLYDAVLVAGGRESVDALAGNGEAVHYVAEAFKHAKPIAALSEGIDLLRRAALPDARLAGDGDGDDEVISEAGVVTLARPQVPGGDGAGDGLRAFASALADAVAAHRHFERRLEAVPA